MEQVWEIIQPLLLMVITAIVSAAGNELRKYLKELGEQAQRTKIEQTAFEALADGVAKAQEEFVRGTKRMREGGKLTIQDMQQAKNIAITHAKMQLSGPSSDVFAAWTTERVERLIRAGLQLIKK